MKKYSGIVDMHKRFVKELIDESDQRVTLRMPAPVTATGTALFGDMSRETAKTGSVKGPFTCLWYDALSPRSMGQSGTGFEQKVERLAGQYTEATSFAELWLDSVLVDPADKSGLTHFDQAQDIIYNGKLFKFLGDERLGLSTSVPYILMVVLKGGVGYVD